MTVLPLVATLTRMNRPLRSTQEDKNFDSKILTNPTLRINKASHNIFWLLLAWTITIWLKTQILDLGGIGILNLGRKSSSTAAQTFSKEF